MIDVNKLKVGVTFTEEGQPFRVMKYDFTKMGRVNATIKVKAKNLLNGAIVTKGFISGNMVEDILLDKKHLQYLYKDDEKGYFMDPVSFDQFEIPVRTELLRYSRVHALAKDFRPVQRGSVHLSNRFDTDGLLPC